MLLTTACSAGESIENDRADTSTPRHSLAFGANDPDSTDASQDDLCPTARRVAEAAVDTLIA